MARRRRWWVQGVILSIH